MITLDYRGEGGRSRESKKELWNFLMLPIIKDNKAYDEDVHNADEKDEQQKTGKGGADKNKMEDGDDVNTPEKSKDCMMQSEKLTIMVRMRGIRI